MKKIHYLLVFLVICLEACRFENTPILVKADYEKYLQPIAVSASMTFEKQEIDFWEKKMQNGNRSYIFLTKIAKQLESKFRKSGHIQDLMQARSLLLEANQDAQEREASIYQLLALNSITRHAFQEAKQYLMKATTIHPKNEITKLILADVYLELGETEQTNSLLNSFKQKQNFDVMVRKAKLLDHQGKLDETIKLMEQALVLISTYNNKTFEIWTLTNLADFYGHAGQVKKSYEFYLKTLAIDNQNDYALKGLAWIAYAHDKNLEEAKRLLTFIASRNQSPEYNLKLAEIASYEGNEIAKNKYLQAFKQETEKPVYGDMYNTYLHELYADEWGDFEKAHQIAMREIENRPTAQSYALLAWTFYKQGVYQKAYEIAEKQVKGKTHEPHVAMQLGFIYQKVNRKNEANAYFQNALASSFELGLVATKSIQKALKN